MENKIKYSIFGILGIVFLSLMVFFFIKSSEPEIVGEVLSNEIYDKNFISPDTSSGSEIKNNDEEIELLILPKVRILCKVGSVKMLLGSNSFLHLKNSIQEDMKKSDDYENFVNYNLVSLVYSTCGSQDELYSDTLLRYLQYETNEKIISDKETITKIDTLIDNLEYNYDGVDKTKIKNDGEYFNEVVFKDNLENIKKSYFPEYLINKENAKDFFYTYSIYSLEETNARLEKSIGKFKDFAEKLGFDGIKELRNYILKFAGYSDLDTFKNELMAEYKKMKLVIKKNLGFNIDEKFISLDSTYEFYISEDYKKLIEDKTINEMFNDIGKKHLMFSIVNYDHADGLDETWSGKEFFGDEVIGNSIIKIGYFYLLNNIN